MSDYEVLKEQKIDVLEGLEGIRMRPSMYVGDVESGGLHHLAREIIDNSVDEIANDYGDICKVILWEDGSLSVEDNGRGIPVAALVRTILPAFRMSYTFRVFT